MTPHFVFFVCLYGLGGTGTSPKLEGNGLVSAVPNVDCVPGDFCWLTGVVAVYASCSFKPQLLTEGKNNNKNEK